jgi:hypothetical protein
LRQRPQHCYATVIELAAAIAAGQIVLAAAAAVSLNLEVTHVNY